MGGGFGTTGLAEAAGDLNCGVMGNVET